MNIFLTALRNLEIVDPGESSFEIMPGINFTNSNLVKAYLMNDIVVQAIGVIEYNYILQSKNIAFYKYDQDDFRGHDNETLFMGSCLNGSIIFSIAEKASNTFPFTSIKFFC